MICEMCGNNVPSTRAFMVEGTMLNLCPNCSKFGDSYRSSNRIDDGSSHAGSGNNTLIKERLEKRERRMQTRDIYAASMGDCIRPAMREMAEKVFTHVPILEDGRVVGVFSENTLLAYMNTSNIVVISENDTFEKVRDFLPLDRHVSEKFAFVSRGTIATEVVKLFQDSLAQRVRLGMVFVTEHGEPDEELLGIITAWDMAAFF